MKNIILLVSVLFLSFTIKAEVVKPSEKAIENDLNFKYEEEVDSQRAVASEEEEADEAIEEDTDRDLASEGEELDTTLQYWKY